MRRSSLEGEVRTFIAAFSFKICKDVRSSCEGLKQNWFNCTRPTRCLVFTTIHRRIDAERNGCVCGSFFCRGGVPSSRRLVRTRNVEVDSGQWAILGFWPGRPLHLSLAAAHPVSAAPLLTFVETHYVIINAILFSNIEITSTTGYNNITAIDLESTCCDECDPLPQNMR